MTDARTRPVQHLSDEYLERCREMSPREILAFLEDFRLMHGSPRSVSRLISIKIPEELLETFRRRCQLEGTPYQTQIKRLMRGWLETR